MAVLSLSAGCDVGETMGPRVIEIRSTGHPQTEQALSYPHGGQH